MNVIFGTYGNNALSRLLQLRQGGWASNMTVLTKYLLTGDGRVYAFLQGRPNAVVRQRLNKKQLKPYKLICCLQWKAYHSSRQRIRWIDYRNVPVYAIANEFLAGLSNRQYSNLQQEFEVHFTLPAPSKTRPTISDTTLLLPRCPIPSSASKEPN
jgi:hypothetical protein